MKANAFPVAAFACAMLAIAGAHPAKAADPKGNWFTADRESQVRIADCGGALCGSISWLKEPNDPATGKPKTDKNNSDAAKRTRPLMGVQIVLGMKPAGADKWQGQVYNATDGKTYTGNITMIDAKTLKLEGLHARHHLQGAELDARQLSARVRK